MHFEPASEGFLDFFKKKSKQPSKVEKSNISERMKPTNPLVEANIKLMEMYPEDTQKEFKKRKAFLKELLNIITEASKKFKDIPGLNFNKSIDLIKDMIQEKDNDDMDYIDFVFMHNLIPTKRPIKENDDNYGFEIDWYLPVFWYDIWEWAENCKYKEEFKSNKRLVRDFDDTKEWYSILESVSKFFESKLNNNEFTYMIACGGDWDDGNYCITFKPSKEIQQLAARCSSFKPF